MAAPSERRASRLSAYYSRAAAPPPPPAPASTSDERAPPELRGRDAALQHADELSRSQPLDALLEHAARARSRSDTLQHAAHSSTRHHYEQLRAAIAAARSARMLAGHVLDGGKRGRNDDAPPLSVLRRGAQRCGDVGNSLQPTRARLARLDGVRVVQLLRSAAQLLSTQLPALHAELTLCTDPETARDNMLVAARRFDAVRPAVQHLAKSDAHFAQVLQQLCDAAQQVNDALREERVEALTTVECARVRLLLGEAPDALREQLLADAAARICANTLSHAALIGGACERAAMYVSFARAHIVPALHEAARDYREVFAVNDELDWAPFVVWAAHVSDDAFAGDVRQQLHADVLAQRGAVHELRDALDALVEEGAARENDELQEVLRSVTHTLRAAVVEAALTQRDAALHALVEQALAGGAVDGEAVVLAARQLASKGEWFAQSWSARELLARLGQFAVDRALASSHMTLARAARLCERVGKCAAGEGEGEVGAQLLQARHALVRRLLRALVERADDVMTARIAQLSAARACDDAATKRAARGMDELRRLLRDARRIGEECGIECIVGGDAHELLGEEEQLARCVGRVFVHRVREVVVDEFGARELQMDAWGVREFVGDGCFDDVSAALAERCVDEVRLLSREQAAAAAARARGGDAGGGKR